MPLYYGCDVCVEVGAEIVCWPHRDAVRVMPNGKWLCQYCFDYDMENHGVEPLALDEAGYLYAWPMWSDFPPAPEMVPKIDEMKQLNMTHT